MKRKAKKKIEEMLNGLNERVGEDSAGLLLALICDSLDHFVKGTDGRTMRTIEITINNFYSLKYNLETDSTEKRP